MSESCPSELCLPPGWRRKEVSIGAGSQRTVFYRSPSGLLYRTPKAVLAHMRSEGSHTRDQVDQFRAEVERWQDTCGQAKTVREGRDCKEDWEEQQADIPPSTDCVDNDNMKKKIMEALSGGKNETNKKTNVASKASEFENVLKTLKSKKTKSSKRKREGEELVVTSTPLEKKKVKLPLKMPNGKVNQELEQKQPSSVFFGAQMQSSPGQEHVPFLNIPGKEKANKFQCNMCGNEYSHKGSLLKHVKKKHGENQIPDNYNAATVKTPKRGNGQEKKQTFEEVNTCLSKNVHKKIKSLALSIRSNSPMSLSQYSSLPKGWSPKSSLPKGLSRDSSLPMGWSKDSSLPQGWSVATDAGRQVYRAPGGRQLDGRVQALLYMLELGSPPEEMFQLWSSLDEEGWMVEDSLPTGWRKRTTEDGDEEFLSPMMEVVPRSEAFLQCVLSGGV